MNIKCIHIFGKRIKDDDGTIKLARFLKEYTDEEFYELTRYGLPNGWVAWHIMLPASEKVRKSIMSIPIIMTLDVLAGWVPSNPEPELRAWIEKQKQLAADVSQ